MNIPPKYEDLVFQLNELNKREAELREELARYKSLFGQAQKAIDRLNELHPKRMGELAKRLTVAEQRAGELEGLLHMSKELLTTISRHGATTKPVDWCDSFKAEVADRIEKIGDALKPAAEGEGS